MKRWNEILVRDTVQTEELDECLQQTGLRMGVSKRLKRDIEEIEEISLVDIVQGAMVCASLGPVEHEACDEVLLVTFA